MGGPTEGGLGEGGPGKGSVLGGVLGSFCGREVRDPTLTNIEIGSRH